jgi:Tol biopolymer transport system component/DNA-binding winged helix-turn-helix (wHTH) protein
MSGKLQFGVYELDRDALELRKQGVPIRLQEQPLRVLATLLERPGEIVTREELRARIWGDTFVDFEQSLNKSVNRLREALNDDAGQPRYVETVPRRGYRFIAPVTAPVPVARPSTAPGSVSDAGPASPRPAGVHIGLIAILTAGVLLAIAILAIIWAKWPGNSKPSETTHIASAAFCCSTLSRDGKLLAYVSGAGNGVIHIWVQQTAGGQALRVTSGPDGETSPDFSPDGTHIAFLSGNGGIYIVPTLSGEPKLLTTKPALLEEIGFPTFSPGGDRILYKENDKAMTVSVNGGKPVSLGLNRDLVVRSRPFWSPDGDAILFRGVSRQQPDKPEELWIVPIDRGEPRSVSLPGVERDDMGSWKALACVRSNSGGQWIIYSVFKGERWKIFRVRASSQGQIDSKPEELAYGTSLIGVGWASVSDDGKLVYTIGKGASPIYEIPTGGNDPKPGPPLQLPLAEGGIYFSPSLSHDGRWMAYDATLTGKPNMIVLRDLASDVDHVMDEVGRRSHGETTISPDGSKVAFERDCKNDLPCSFIMAVAGGEPDQICESCTPRGFSSNGSIVLVQNYNRDGKPPHTIAAIDLTSRTERNFLRASQGSVYHAFFSWDDRWVVFREQQYPELDKPKILIAPVRNGVAGNEAEWIAVTDGKYNDDKPQFSPDGNVLYFTSDRDGYFCIWALRLDPATKRPVGGPFPYEHFHSSAQRPQGPLIPAHGGDIDLSVARDKMMINLPEYTADIWMMQVP